MKLKIIEQKTLKEGRSNKSKVIASNIAREDYE